MIRLGRTFTAVAYVEPAGSITASQLDALRLGIETELMAVLQSTVLCEVVPTAVHPYNETIH